MSDELTSAADLATGTILSRAIEPEAGEGVSAGVKTCLNCGEALISNHCHTCGQKAVVHRTLSAFGHDLLHSIFHFEGKIWRTLPLLAFNPGDLTRRYVHGERAKFVSPLALFLFSVFLMFASLSWTSNPINTNDGRSLNEKAATSVTLQKQLTKVRTEISEVSRKRERLKASGADLQEVEADLAILRRQENALNFAAGMNEGGIDVHLEEDDLKEWNGKGQTGWARLDDAIGKASDNPQLLLYKIKSSAYKFSWALVPLSLPFLWLLFFWRREFKLYDHAIFITYSLCFITLGAIALSLTSALGAPNGVIATLAFLLPPIHMYRQLRGAYQLGRWNAILRTSLLVVSALIVIGLFSTTLLFLGLLG